MDNEKIAKELIKLAKELVSTKERQAIRRGKYVDVEALPDTLQSALKRIGFRKPSIEVIQSNKWQVSTAFEGNRAMAFIVNLATGRVTEGQTGSWGGANPFEDRQIDRPESQPVPQNSAVIAGEHGGRGSFFRMYVRPGDLDEYMDTEEVELTDDEKKALNIIGGIKSGYRKDEFRRYRLGEYGPDNPLVQSLADKGLVKIMSMGIKITTLGKNAR